MKVSIIMPTYNRAKTLSRAIDSILNQSYENFELIVVDDGSTDNSKEIVNSFNDRRIIYIYQENAGACSARNRGILEASGEYICFLDSDDEWNTFKLEKQLKFIKEKKSMIAFCNYYYEKNGKSSVAIKKLNVDYLTLNDLLDRNYVTTGALIVKKDIMSDIGMFDIAMPRYQDWELALRLSRNNKIYFQNECLLTLHYQEISISNSTSLNKKLLALENMLKKNLNDYKLNNRAYAHICWSMGMYSLCLGKDYNELLRTGVFYYKINFKRLLIYALIRLGFKKYIVRKYVKNH